MHSVLIWTLRRVVINWLLLLFEIYATPYSLLSWITSGSIAQAHCWNNEGYLHMCPPASTRDPESYRISP